MGRQEREDWLLISHFAFRILRKPQQQFGVLDGSTVYPPHDGSSAFPFDNGAQAAFTVCGAVGLRRSPVREVPD